MARVKENQQKQNLENQVVIVTGASRGIGQATSILLAAEGAKLILASRNIRELEKVAMIIKEMGRDCLVVKTDICDEAQVSLLVNKSLEKYDSIDILINNAGVGLWKPVVNCSTKDWDYMLNTNLRGVFLCSRSVIPVMVGQNRGCIVNVASQAGKQGIANLAIYCASKFGVIGFSESLKQELAPYNIKVSYVCPGYVNTNFFKNSDENFVMPKNIRMVQPEDVARDIVKLISGNTRGQEIKRKLTARISHGVLRKIKKLYQALEEENRP